jgi:hypothetical protein
MKKNFQGYLIINYHTGKMRIASAKRKQRYKAAEIPVKLSINITIPEMKEYVAKAEIEVSQTKVKEMIFDSI